jgi:sugar lactone lactonase YvrE
MIGCMENGLYLLMDDGGMAPLLAPMRLDGPRFNDVKAGPDGCLYGGTINYEGRGAFYRVTPSLRVTTLLTGIGNANGLDWDENRFYFNDTPTLRTDVFAFDAATGTLADRRSLRRYDAGTDGNPDGMTLDGEGRLWVALWGHGRVICMEPDTGRIVREIRLPVSNVCSVAFAGDDLRDLVITTAAHGTSLRQEPLAGAVFHLRADAPGRLPYLFDDREESQCD